MDRTGIIVMCQNHVSMDMCLTHKTRSAMGPEYLLNIINMLHKLITLNSWTRGKNTNENKVLAVKGTFGSRPVD